MFNVEFKDQTGEIRATGFNEQLDKFYESLTVDNVNIYGKNMSFIHKNLFYLLNSIKQKVYYISRAQLKTANRQYSKIDNDYEITFGNETVIEPCHETENIPHAHLKLTPLDTLITIEPNSYVGEFFEKIFILSTT